MAPELHIDELEYLDPNLKIIVLSKEFEWQYVFDLYKCLKMKEFRGNCTYGNFSFQQSWLHNLIDYTI